MERIEIEFFHDVICSFCFPMSYRMRKLQEMMPDIKIIHRSFALVKTENDFNSMFGSRRDAKDEILSHWYHANQNDYLHRFNIEGMKKADFLFPTSMSALTACKAAYFAGGDSAYWDLFDAIQSALFMKNRNVEEYDVIVDCVQQTSLDVVRWKELYLSSEVKISVENDFLIAKKYGIQSVPSLVINGESILQGEKSLEKIKEFINIRKLSSGMSCNLNNGKWNCE